MAEVYGIVYTNAYEGVECQLTHFMGDRARGYPVGQGFRWEQFDTQEAAQRVADELASWNNATISKPEVVVIPTDQVDKPIAVETDADELPQTPQQALTELGFLDDGRAGIVQEHMDALEAFVARIAAFEASGKSPFEIIRLRKEARALIDWQSDAAQEAK